MKPAQISASLRRLADSARSAFPEMSSHQHLRDAAGALDAGDPHAAQRHLHAAIATFTPQSIRRHGLHDDVSHVAAKEMMGQAHRHLLLVKDVEDADQQQQDRQFSGQSHAIELAAMVREQAGL